MFPCAGDVIDNKVELKMGEKVPITDVFIPFNTRQITFGIVCIHLFQRSYWLISISKSFLFPNHSCNLKNFFLQVICKSLINLKKTTNQHTADTLDIFESVCQHVYHYQSLNVARLFPKVIRFFSLMFQFCINLQC